MTDSLGLKEALKEGDKGTTLRYQKHHAMLVQLLGDGYTSHTLVNLHETTCNTP